MNSPKYVAFQLKGESQERIMLVDSMQTHSQSVRQLAYNLVEDVEPYTSTAAGFISIGSDRERNVAFSAYGQSSSLKSCQQAHLARESDGQLFAKLHADKGLLYTLHGYSNVPNMTILDSSFTVEELAKVFNSDSIVAQGYVKFAINDDCEVIVKSIEHIVKPEGRLAEAEHSRILSLIGASYY